MKLLLTLFLFGWFPFRALANGGESVTFSEMMPNPDGTDTKENEYIKLRNSSAAAIDLAGWKICNISNDCYQLAGRLEANSCLKLFRRDFLFVLHNDREELKLYDNAGNVVSAVTTDAAPSGKAWLCNQGYCQWDAPRENCDYEDIAPAGENADTDSLTTKNPSESQVLANLNVNSDGNSNSNENTNSNNNTNNNNSSASKRSNLKIASARDWEKAEKKMYSENRLSLPADLRGKIAIPLNLIKTNYFSVVASGKLVQVNLYASRKDEFIKKNALYEPGATVKIKSGFLKNNGQGWLVGVGKGTSVDISAGKNFTNHKGLTPSAIKDFSGLEGKTSAISGKILKKNGDYFFVAPEGSSEKSFAVFVPKAVWFQYLIKKNIGPFPQLENGKVRKFGDLKNKRLRALGVVEVAGDTSRLVVVNARNLTIGESKEDDQATGSREGSSNNDNGKQEAQSAAPRRQEDTTAAQETAVSQPDNISGNNNGERLKAVLSQKLNWKILSAIAWQKIKRGIANLF